jgi:pyruvate dehydrogenase E2 component (dihydrolipoamide acetyltransferase)
MAQEITIPRLGWSMEEGIFGEWLKAPGEYVRSGEMIFLLEGEKAAQEIEALDSGYLCVPDDAPRPGATVKVGQVIGFLLAEGEATPVSVGKPPAGTSPASSTPAFAIAASLSPPAVSPPSVKMPLAPAVLAATGTMPRVAGPAARRLTRELGIDLNAVFTPDPTGRVLCEDIQRTAKTQRHSVQPVGPAQIATPRARRRARELGVDWTQLPGTGRNGRIRERDIISQPMATAGSQPLSPEPTPVTLGKHTPASKLRRILAQRMLAGVTQAAPVTLTTKVDAAQLVAYRANLKSLAPKGQAPSFNDILIGLAAQTLRALPELNACWHRDGIHAYDAIHVATAVDAPAGLLAPVIRHADQLSIAQIAEQTRQLIAQARAGRLNQTHLEGGTFTVTNLGMFGIDTFTPVLNLPQAGILGIGRIVEEPVVRAGRLEIGHTLFLSLTFDHRVVDGAPAARWLQRLCEHIQTPENQPGA